MASRGKKYKKIKESQPTEIMMLVEGIEKVKKLSYSTFEGTLELHLNLKLPKDKDPKSLKGSISLPHSSGAAKEVKIAVFTSSDREDEAKKAGADFYKLADLVAAVKKGNIEFDIAIATPDVMPQIAAIGKELGPRGLMPNPKTGTVTDDFAGVVEEYKKGKMNFKSDLTGVMHFNVGKLSMDTDKLVENIKACVEAAGEVVGKKPAQLIKGAHLAPTMGPSVKVEIAFEE